MGILENQRESMVVASLAESPSSPLEEFQEEFYLSKGLTQIHRRQNYQSRIHIQVGIDKPPRLMQ